MKEQPVNNKLFIKTDFTCIPLHHVGEKKYVNEDFYLLLVSYCFLNYLFMYSLYTLLFAEESNI